MAREHKNIIHYKRVRRKHSRIVSHVNLNLIYRQFLIRPTCLFYLQCLEECDSHGLPPTEQGRLDLELKIEDTKENMRKAEVCTLLIPSQLNIEWERETFFISSSSKVGTNKGMQVRKILMQKLQCAKTVQKLWGRILKIQPHRDRNPVIAFHNVQWNHDVRWNTYNIDKIKFVLPNKHYIKLLFNADCSADLFS